MSNVPVSRPTHLGGSGLRVDADAIGPIRRHLGLPARPLEASLPYGPPGAVVLREGEEIPL